MDKRKTFFLLLMLSLVFAILSCSREESNPIDDGGGNKEIHILTSSRILVHMTLVLILIFIR